MGKPRLARTQAYLVVDATWLAAHHRPRRLILQAPYYSLADVGDHLNWPLRLIPGFVHRYPMPTYE